MQGGLPAFHILNLQGLGVGPWLTGEEYDFPIYTWDSYTYTGKVPLTVQVEPAWILSSKGRITVNNMAMADTALPDAEPPGTRVALNGSVATEMCGNN